MCKGLGRLSQGYSEKGSNYHIQGKNTKKVLNHKGIGKIPRDRMVIYARIVVDYIAQKKDHDCVGITICGNLLKGLYQGELTTRTSDMRNSVISTPGPGALA